MLQVLQHGGVQVQRVVLLREVADLAAVPVFHHAGVRIFDMREQTQCGGLTGAVVSQDHHARAFVDRQIDAGEHDVRPVRLGDVLGLDRRAAAGCRLREADVRHLLLPLRLAGLGEQAFSAAHHVLRGHGLGGFGVQADALLHQAFGFLLGHFAFTASAFLVHRALAQVRLPSERVHVDLPALRIQMPDLVHHLVQKLGGVGDDQKPALVFLQIPAQPFDRIGVQMVGRLVQDHRVRIGEQDPRQLHTAALPAGERAERLVHDLLRQSQRFGHRVGLGLRRVTAGLVEVLHGLVVAVHGLGHHVRIRVGHLAFGLAHAADDGRDVARAHHTVERGLVRIVRMRVLRQIPEFARDTHFAAGGQHLAGDHARQRGLAGAVAAYQTDLVSLGYVEVGGVQQRACTDLNLQSLRLDGHRSP